MATKKEIFEQTLTSAYDSQKYVDFIREMITGVKILAPEKASKPYNTFSAFVENFYHVGEYVDKDGESIGIFAVELKRGESIERARTAQRTFVKSLLTDGGYAGALVAFYSEGGMSPINITWRFSFIRMDYEFAKGKIKETLTPAKRYSYLVGNGEPCHTAMDRLYPIFVDDSLPPTLDELEEAFSVETVTKEFFEKYKEKYLEMHDFLEQNEDFARESRIRGFTAEQFTKKLLSQIVFLYFVQKKGWLGVTALPPVMMEREYKNAFFAKGSKSRELVGKVYVKNERGTYDRNAAAIRNLSTEDEEILSTIVKGRPWGTGPKNFMRSIFNDCVKRGGNFFDDYLEPLFYTGLNKNRGENAFFPPLHCRIPFLNGGLFEELDNYDWENNDFQIPNEMFSNVDTKGRDADGVLDIFDRYNFTMAEDEPMEREVAVDPEMLGKVFENLLEVKDRKSKGAFYTPREIVHYMCQESLINYLVTKSGISEEDIRKLVLYGEYFKDKDAEKTKRVANKNGNGFHMELDKDKEFEIPPSIFSYKDGVNRIKELDDYLANVKVVDPAVGSGAFPLGMLNEIVKARDTLSTYLTLEMNPFEKKAVYAPGFVGSRSPYDLKAETIKNCIFACDIEPSAADISKLRLWLSLVIDDELSAEGLDGGTFGEHSKPKQLPNLDCNIICGNSLDDTFGGINLIKESDILNNISGEHQENMMQTGVDAMITTLISLQDKLFYTKEPLEKQEIKEQIQKIYNAVIEEQLKFNPALVQKYRASLSESSRPFILWQLYFPRVFKNNGGFDICIGNPPYIQLQSAISEDSGVKLGDLYNHLNFKTFTKTGDIYCLFYEKGAEVLCDNGVLTFITSNKWMRAGYGKQLRKYLSEKTNPIQLVDFAGQKIFDTATVDVNILITCVSSNKGQTITCTVKEECKDNLNAYVHDNGVTSAFDTSEIWTIVSQEESKIRKKLESVGKPLEKWEDLNVDYGIKTGFNDAFVVSTDEKDSIIKNNPEEEELFVPLLRGKDILAYTCKFADLWLINSHNGNDKDGIKPIDINDYPAIKVYLDQYIEKLTKRADKGMTPYNLRSCAYLERFFEPKIMFQEIVQEPSFMLDNDEHYFCLDTGRIITGKYLEYLVGLLNSKLFFYAIKKFYGGGGLGGHAIRMKSTFFGKFPAVLPTEQEYAAIKEKYYSMESDRDSFSKYIDEYLYNKYNFSKDEIDIIERVFVD